METKFVPQLLEPKEVILGAALTNFGPAFGVKKFVDGSFAVRYANGVVLYEQSGKVLDAGLDDVLMFPWGFKLFKKSNSPSWYLVDASGNNILCYIKCEAKKVYVNEINSIPGSLAFYLWDPKGKDYTELLDDMISIAIKDYKKRESKTHSFNTNILQGFAHNGLKGMKGKLQNK